MGRREFGDTTRGDPAIRGRTGSGPDGRGRHASRELADAAPLQQGERLLADSVPVQLWTARPDGRLDYVNRRMIEYFGFGADALLGRGWHSSIHSGDLDAVLERWGRALTSGEPFEAELRLRRADGRYRWHISRAVPECDDDDRVRRWFGSNTDISERREVETAQNRALAEANFERQELYGLLMQAPAAIAVLEGPEHVFTMSNPLYQELTGHRALIGKPIREAMPELRQQGFFEKLDAVYSSGKPFSARERLVKLDRDRDGVPEDFYVDFVYQPLEDARGRIFGIMAHAVDVTQQVRSRLEIAAAHAEAERANQAKSEFLAAMSHDLRTPLNAIGGYADLVADGVYGPVTEAQANAMQRIRRAQGHLLALIHDILSYARIEAGRLTIEIADITVNETLAELRPMIEPQVAAKGLTFTCQGARGEVRMRADRERVIQILLNLLTNAVKFTTAGSISIECEATDTDVRIRVRDTGPGIAGERIETIFEPFVQVGQSSEEGRQGIGLGLAISRELAHAMHGDLTVESAVGEGSAFTLSLPRSEER